MSEFSNTLSQFIHEKNIKVYSLIKYLNLLNLFLNDVARLLMANEIHPQKKHLIKWLNSCT